MRAADLHAVEEAADRAFASATIAGLPRWAAEAAADSARVVASAAIGPEALAEVRAAQESPAAAYRAMQRAVDELRDDPEQERQEALALAAGVAFDGWIAQPAGGAP